MPQPEESSAWRWLPGLLRLSWAAKALVSLEPSADKLASLPENGTYRRHQLPPATVSRSGEDFAVTVDARDVPPDYVSDEGLVTFRIEAVDPVAENSSALIATARRITMNGQQRWAPASFAPEILDESVRTRSALTASLAAKAPHVEEADVGRTYPREGAPPGAALDERLPRLAGKMRPALEEALVARRGEDSLTDAPPAANYASGDCSLGDSRIREATVGTSYPMLGASRSWLEYSSSSTSSFGVAFKGGGGWYEAGGAKTISDDRGGDFWPGSKNRSYRVDVEYRYEVCRSYKFGTVTSRGWVPVQQTGGGRGHLLNQHVDPGWRNYCAPVNIPVWSRGRQEGTEYSLGYGVKIKDVVGFNMSSTHGYTSAARLYYKNSSKRAICGAGEWPSSAGKMMERYHSAASY